MLKIKLARFGKRHQPHYRVVVNEARDKRDGSYVAAIGQYAPTQTPKILHIDLDAYKAWLSKGAQPTDTVASLVKRFESGNPFPARAAQPSKKARAKAEAAKAAAAEAAAAPAPVEEAPVAEAASTEAASSAEPAAETPTEETPATT